MFNPDAPWGDDPHEWLVRFRQEVDWAAQNKRWTRLTHTLVMMGAEPPDAPINPTYDIRVEFPDFQMEAYVEGIRAALHPVRRQVRAVIQKDLRRPDNYIGKSGPYGAIVLKSYGEWLLSVI